MKWPGIHGDLASMNRKAREELHDLTSSYGPLEDLAAEAGLTERQAPVTAGPGATHATAQANVAPPLQPTDPVPAPGSVSADTRARTAGPATLPSIAELLSAPPGPSSRVLPAGATQTSMVPAREVPLAQREAIAEQEQAVDLLTVFHSLRGIRGRYLQQSHKSIDGGLKLARDSITRFVRPRYERLGGDFGILTRTPALGTKAEQAYKNLGKMAGQAEDLGDSAKASAIRKVLNDIDRYAAELVGRIFDERVLGAPSYIRRSPPTPAAGIPQWDWCTAHRNLVEIKKYFERAGLLNDAIRFRKCLARLKDHVYHRFGIFGKNQPLLSRCADHPSRPVQMYLILENIAHRAELESGAGELPEICKSMNCLNEKARKELQNLTRDYGSLAALAAKAGVIEQQAPATLGPMATPAMAQATVAPSLSHMDPVPGSVSADTRPRTEGAAALPSAAELPSTPPGPEVPLAQRRAIVERFRSEDAVHHARAALGTGAADALGWSDAQADRVLVDLHRLSTSAAMHPATAAALHDIDWSVIEALLGITDAPPPPQSPSLSLTPSPDV